MPTHKTLKSRPPVMAPAALGDLLNDEQAAAFLSITSRTLRLWRQSLGLPHFKLTAKVIRYRQSDLDAWVNRRRTAIAA